MSQYHWSYLFCFMAAMAMSAHAEAQPTTLPPPVLHPLEGLPPPGGDLSLSAAVSGWIGLSPFERDNKGGSPSLRVSFGISDMFELTTEFAALNRTDMWANGGLWVGVSPLRRERVSIGTTAGTGVTLLVADGENNACEDGSCDGVLFAPHDVVGFSLAPFLGVRAAWTPSSRLAVAGLFRASYSFPAVGNDALEHPTVPAPWLEPQANLIYSPLRGLTLGLGVGAYVRRNSAGRWVNSRNHATAPWVVSRLQASTSIEEIEAIADTALTGDLEAAEAEVAARLPDASTKNPG